MTGAAARVLAFKPGLDIQPIAFRNRRCREVFRALVTHINRKRGLLGDTVVYPAVETLAGEADCSARTARRALRDLQADTLIEPVDAVLKNGGSALKDGKPKGGHTSARYRILVSLSPAKLAGQGGQFGRAGRTVWPTNSAERTIETTKLASLAGETSERAIEPGTESAPQPATIPGLMPPTAATPRPATDKQRAFLAVLSREVDAPLTEWASREALTAAEADQIIGPANRCRRDHEHDPRQWAPVEPGGLVRCRCGAVAFASTDADIGFTVDGPWWLGCPPAVEVDEYDEPIASDDPDDAIALNWGRLPEQAREVPHVCGKCGVGAKRWIGRCAHCKAWNTLEPGKAQPATPEATAAWRAERSQETADAIRTPARPMASIPGWKCASDIVPPTRAELRDAEAKHRQGHKRAADGTDAMMEASE